MEVLDQGNYSSIIKGLYYEDDFISEEEEEELLSIVNDMEWTNLLKRRVQKNGYGYDYVKQKIQKIGDRPEELMPITKNISKRIWREGQLFNQITVNESLPGQG